MRECLARVCVYILMCRDGYTPIAAARKRATPVLANSMLARILDLNQ